MVRRYDTQGHIDCVETKTGRYVSYEDYAALERRIDARAITDCVMPPRIEDIQLRSPQEVEDMWRERVKWLCAHLGVKVHD